MLAASRIAPSVLRPVVGPLPAGLGMKIASVPVPMGIAISMTVPGTSAARGNASIIARRALTKSRGQLRNKSTTTTPSSSANSTATNAGASSSASANEAANSSNGEWATFLRPLCKSTVMIGLSMALGDFTCQHIEQWNREDGIMNYKRSVIFGLIGTFITGPVSFTFQWNLEKWVPGKAIVQVLKKTLFNSTFAFIVSLPLMFTAVTLLQPGPNGEQRTLEDAKRKIKADLVPTFITAAFFWPMVNIIVYRYVATINRATVSSMVGVLWNIYLSMMANKNVESEPSDYVASM